MSRLNRKRAAVVLLGLLLALGIGLAVSRYLIVSAARGVFDHWSSAGLPGNPPNGKGPFVDMAWPPHVRWSELRWGDGDAPRLSCDRLEVTITPLSLVRGRLIPSRIEIGGLQVSGMGPLTSWSDLLIESLDDSSTASPPEGGPEAVRIRIAPVTFDSSSVRLSEIDGWIRAVHKAGVEFAASISSGDPSGTMVLRGGASWSVGSSEITVAGDIGQDRLLYAHASRPPAGGWRWQVSGRDDGTIVSALLRRRPGLADGVRGTVDFSLSRVPLEGVEGEAVLRDVSIGLPRSQDEGGLTLNGRVCLEKSVLSLQEVDLAGGDSRVRIDADVPLLPDGHVSGSCSIAGTWKGSDIRIDGTIRRIRDRLVLSASHIDLSGGRTGPVDLRWIIPGPDDRLIRLEGVVRIGAGAISIVGGSGSIDDPLLLRCTAIPMSDLGPWLPLRTLGAWSGELDAFATLCLARDGWSGNGTASLKDGRIRGIRLPEQIRSLSGAEVGDVRLERVSTRWSYSRGSFIADSLRLQTRAIRVRGTLIHSPPDSIFGILQLSSEEGTRLESMFRLIGGDSALLDVGISGSDENPAVELLDPAARDRWWERLDQFRRSNRQSLIEAQSMPAARDSG